MTTNAPERPETAAETPAAADVHSEQERGKAAQRPPSEAEIRDVVYIDAGLGVTMVADDIPGILRQVTEIVAAPLIDSGRQTMEGRGVWEPLVEAPDGAMWSDLRPTEAVRLADLVSEAVGRAVARCQAIIVDEVVAAGLAFAAEHPDAPRSVYAVEVED